jgi:hypothetical protein
MADSLPTRKNLEDDLRKIRTKSVGHPLGKATVPYLGPLARELAQDPDLPLPLLIEDVLREAIKRFKGGPFAESLAALFGFTEAEDGTLRATKRRLRVEERRDLAAEILGVDPQSFDKIRNDELLGTLADQLLLLHGSHRRRVSSRAKGQRRGVHSTDTLYATAGATLLFKYAAHLRYAVLAGCFTAHADHHIDFILKDFTGTLREVEVCNRQAFHSYVDFAIVSIDAAWSPVKDPGDPGVPSTVLDEVKPVLNRIYSDGSPFTAGEQLKLCRNAIPARPLAENAELRKAYYLTWHPWYKRRLSTPGVLQLRLVIARLGEVEAILQEHIGSQESVLAESRSRALRLISRYYDIGTATNIIGDGSLGYFAADYFDSLCVELGVEHSIWENELNEV